MNDLFQGKSKKTVAVAIILFVIGLMIFVSSLITFIQGGAYFIGKIYSSIFTYLIAGIFGRMGWGMHLGVVLVCIALYLLMQRNAFKLSESIANGDRFEHVERQELSVLSWFGTLILLAIPLVNLILLLVWAFGADNPRKNYSRATLLYGVLGIIITLIVFFATISMVGDSITF